jgi:hypothetical protein
MINAELQQCNGKHAKEHRTPSIIHGTEPSDWLAKEHGTPSVSLPRASLDYDEENGAI